MHTLLSLFSEQRINLSINILFCVRYLEDARWDLEYSKRRLDQATVRIIPIDDANKMYYYIDIVM